MVTNICSPCSSANVSLVNSICDNKLDKYPNTILLSSYNYPIIFFISGTLQADNASNAIHAIASGSNSAIALSGIPSTDNTESVCEPVNVTGLTASADGAFQRRGSGRCYNSLSGKYIFNIY